MLESSYALITGASSGIGECFARALAGRKQNLILVARSKEKLAALAAELRAAHGILAEPMDCDLSIPGAAERLATRLRERNLAVELLVNNAGFGAQGEFAKIDLERTAQMIRLNIQALIELTHHLLPSMIEKRSGAIINVSSTASFQALPYTTVYAASKAFVTSFSLGLAEEVRNYGIRVVTLCPGGTKTDFFKSGDYGVRNFPGGLQTPEEVVEAALRKLDRGGGLVIPRFLNQFGAFLVRFFPRAFVAKMLADLMRPTK